MATLTPVVLLPVSRNTTGATAGQQPGFINANIGGDLVPLTGRFIKVIFKTSGTACNWTLDNVLPSNYGADQDLTVTLAATDLQEVVLANDGRFDQGGVNAGFAKFTPSTVTGTPQIACQVLPS
jgi:hypothetical protein